MGRPEDMRQQEKLNIKYGNKWCHFVGHTKNLNQLLCRVLQESRA